MSNTYVRSLHSSNCFGQMSNVPDNISGTSKADMSKASPDPSVLSLLSQAQKHVEEEEFKACVKRIADASVDDVLTIATEGYEKSLKAVSDRDQIVAQLYSDAMSKETTEQGRNEVNGVVHARGINTSAFDKSTKA
jgi:ribosomal protein L12E/L44/L45/RPP1/RPP2